MAVAHDSSAGVIALNFAGAFPSSPQTGSFTNTSGTLLTVMLGIGQGTNANNGCQSVDSVTYGGVALTRLITARCGANSESVEEIWYLLNPPTGSNTLSVAFTIKVTSVSAATTVWAGAQSFTGAGVPTDSTSTTSNSAASLSLATPVSIPAGDMAIAAYGNGAGAGGSAAYTQTASFTAADFTSTQLGTGHGARASGAGSAITFQETLAASDHAIVLVARIPATGSTSVAPVRLPNQRVGPMALRQRLRRLVPRIFAGTGTTQAITPDAGLTASSSMSASIQRLRPIPGASVAATSNVSGAIQRLRPIPTSTINATSTVTGAIQRLRPIPGGAVNATSVVSGSVIRLRPIPGGSISATSTVAGAIQRLTTIPGASIQATSPITASVTLDGAVTVVFSYDETPVFLVTHL